MLYQHIAHLDAGQANVRGVRPRAHPGVSGAREVAAVSTNHSRYRTTGLSKYIHACGCVARPKSIMSEVKITMSNVGSVGIWGSIS